ncbi:hypothetical protein Tco_1420615 [Tanacetum coccineum]
MTTGSGLLKAADEGPMSLRIFTPEGSTYHDFKLPEDREGESTVSVYKLFCSVNEWILEYKKNMNFPTVTINTKFLNSLQPEWLKYVTQVRLAKQLTVDSFNDLFDYLQQFEKLVNASKAKKLEKSHDPLTLQDDVHNNSKDPLVSAINQAIIQGDRVNIQSRNFGNTGRNSNGAYVSRGDVEGMNAQKRTECSKDSSMKLANLTDEQNNFLFADASKDLKKLENENVSLDFKVQSLIKERNNVKLEYQKLFYSIKKTQSQTQKEIDELIVHVFEKTYAYGVIRAENQNLLSTIFELKTRLEKVEKELEDPLERAEIARERERHAMRLDNSKKAAKNVAVYVRKNKQTDNTSANVISNKENVIDVDVANASKAKTLLCVSCMQNVLFPCHDKCLAKLKLNVRLNVRRTFFTNSRTSKSSKTTFVAPMTRFSEKETQSKTLDTLR